MGWNPTSPLSGSAQTGFTSPTYTLSADVAPDNNGEQHAVTALGGTQPGSVDAHSVSRPFTLTAFRPKTFKSLPAVNPVTGELPSVPYNTYKVITRKGVTPLSGQAARVMLIETVIKVPAGADTADPDNLRAALSCHIGSLSDQSDNVGGITINGVL